MSLETTCTIKVPATNKLQQVAQQWQKTEEERRALLQHSFNLASTKPSSPLKVKRELFATDKTMAGKVLFKHFKTVKVEGEIFSSFNSQPNTRRKSNKKAAHRAALRAKSALILEQLLQERAAAAAKVPAVQPKAKATKRKAKVVQPRVKKAYVSKSALSFKEQLAARKLKAEVKAQKALAQAEARKAKRAQRAKVRQAKASLKQAFKGIVNSMPSLPTFKGSVNRYLNSLSKRVRDELFANLESIPQLSTLKGEF